MTDEPVRPVTALVHSGAAARMEGLLLPVPVERTGFSRSQLTMHRFTVDRQTAGTAGGASLKRIKAAARAIRTSILVAPARREDGTIITKVQRLHPDRNDAVTNAAVRKEKQ